MRNPNQILWKLAFCFTAASILLTAQEAPPPQSKPETPAQAPEAAKPSPLEPVTVPASVDPKSYRLGPDDVVNIRVWREQELTGMHVIRPDGKITMPLIKEIDAKGLTPDELAKRITERLTEIIKEPQVTVDVFQVRSQKYYITGEVNRPGPYYLTGPLTVFDALSLAGGFKEFANKKDIKIIRGTNRLKFNYNDVVKGKNLKQNIHIEPGDTILVP